jgi:hypothetical protein
MKYSRSPFIHLGYKREGASKTVRECFSDKETKSHSFHGTFGGEKRFTEVRDYMLWDPRSIVPNNEAYRIRREARFNGDLAIL